MSALFSLAINLLMLVPSLYMLQLFDRVLQTRSYDTLLYLTLIAVAALAVLGMLDTIRARMLVRVSTWIDRRLAGSTFERSIVAGLRGSPYQAGRCRTCSSCAPPWAARRWSACSTRPGCRSTSSSSGCCTR